uniref:Palmitoyltransferase n=1 Tax=Cacopsylla melanoneura TaxID=428564 RepID=A0A8D8LPK7_9HEMI
MQQCIDNPVVNIIECDEDLSNSNLCCCEYVNHNQERSHILACCCNCVELDQCCENLLCCRGLYQHQVSRVMAMIADKIRIPWRGGARKTAIDTLLPIILVPGMLALAASGVWFSFGVFMCLPLVLVYLHNILPKYIPNTKFFFVWAITTIVITHIMFQWNIVDLLMIETVEIIQFYVLFLGSLFCFFRTRVLAKSNHVKTYSVLPSSSNESIVNMSDDSVNSLTTSFNIRESICTECRKQIPPRAYHCNICNVCVYKRDLHCVWLDCCIGEKNHLMYVVGLLLLLICMIYSANLILICVCAPYYLFLTVQMPEDCSEVYVDYKYAQFFVLAIYFLFISVFLICLLSHEFYMISLGMTGHEWRLTSTRHYYCFRPTSVYSRGFWKNWKLFFANNS